MQAERRRSFGRKIHENFTPCPSSGLRDCSSRSGATCSPHSPPELGVKSSPRDNLLIEFLMNGGSEELINILRPQPPLPKDESAVWLERGGFPSFPKTQLLVIPWLSATVGKIECTRTTARRILPQETSHITQDPHFLTLYNSTQQTCGQTHFTGEETEA